jgi:outer membrane protein TolC
MNRSTFVGLAGALALAAPLAAQAPADTATLTLSAAVQHALAAYPELQAAEATASGAHAAAGRLIAQRLPQLAAQGNVSRFQDPMIVAPLHGLNLQAAPPAFDQTLIQGGLNASYTLFDGGARGARIHGARARAAAADDRVHASSADVIAGTAQAYLEVLTAQAVLAAETQGVTALTAERDRVQQQLDVGNAARVALLRVEAALATAEAGRISATTSLDDAERELARRLGVDPAEARAARLVPVRIADTTVPGRDALLRQADDANPDLRAARRQEEAATWTRRAAVAAWLPHLDLVGGYLVYGSGAGDFSGEWQAGVRLSYPIFTGGARSSAVTEAGAEAAAASAKVRLAEIATANAVDRALSAVRDAAARTAAVEAAVAHLEEVVRIERLSLETGEGTETDFLQSEADLRGARANLARTRATAVFARVSLARLTGTLTPAWITAALETDR